MANFLSLKIGCLPDQKTLDWWQNDVYNIIIWSWENLNKGVVFMSAASEMVIREN